MEPKARNSVQRPVIKGVLLDVNETLFSLRKLEPAFADCGLDPALVSLWFMRVLRDGFALAAAGDFRRFSDIALDALLHLQPQRLAPDAAQRILAAFHTLEPHPDVAPGLQQLREAGIRTMTLTVGDTALAEELFCRAGLSPLVDGFLSAETVRRWKPAPEPYRYGVAQIGWPAANVALIAAHPWDIHGARRVGLQTGWIARLEMPPSGVFDAADVAGKDLPAVVARLLAQSG